MYTMQKLGDATDENGNLKLFYGIVVHIFKIMQISVYKCFSLDARCKLYI